MRSPFGTLLIVTALLVAVTKENANAIINGFPVSENRYPWMAGIVKKGSFAGIPLKGGGVLVDDQWILTAAHVVDGETASSIEVWLGTESLVNPAGRSVRNVLQVFIHPDYRVETGYRNDIALLLLEKPYTLDPPAPLARDGDDPAVGEEVSVAGWGTVSDENVAPNNELLQTTLRVFSSTIAESFFPGAIDDTHIAARDEFTISTPCFGDSGGPLIHNDGITERVVGLVSFGGPGCSDAEVPSICTRVSAFEDWIDSILAFTATPSNTEITGRGRTIPNGDLSPRSADNTSFGTLRTGNRKRTKTYTLRNAGTGLLTVSDVTVLGKRFSLRTVPSNIVSGGSSSVLKVRFKSPRKKRGKALGLVSISTNDPGDPVYRFRIRANVR